MKNNAKRAEAPELLKVVVELIEAHRGCFGQERTHRRGVALVFGEVFAFGRHTVTQLCGTAAMSGC